MGWTGEDRGIARATDYPTTTPSDPLYPCQATDLLGEPLEGVATPALWSCLCPPLERSLRELWRGLGLSRQNLPRSIVALHWGRIALNAHAWERLRSRLLGTAADASLVRPVVGPLEALSERVERGRARLMGARLEKRLEEMREAAARVLDLARKVDLPESDLQDLARGPIDERGWVWILSPWLAERMRDRDRVEGSSTSRVAVALDLEQSFAAELGRRLVERDVLERAADVVYLMAQERMRAAHGDVAWVDARIAERRARLGRFLEVEIPARFWGRPRVPSRQKS